MEQIFVQPYTIIEKTPVISITQEGLAKNIGTKGKGEVVRGIMRWVKVKNNGKTTNSELLNVGQNQYIKPEAVLLEVISTAEGTTTTAKKTSLPTPPIVIMGLPVAGIGFGIWFAHYRITKQAKPKSIASYFGWAALFGFVTCIPYGAWRYNQQKGDLGKVSGDQRDKALTDKSFENLQSLAKKQNKKVSINREEFGRQFSSLTTKEKEAFIFIQEGALNLETTDMEKFKTLYAKLNSTANDKFGETIMESLSNKMGKF